MNEHDVRIHIHQILDSHDAALIAIRSARTLMNDASKAHDDALVSAIEANRAALKLLNGLMNEGIEGIDK